ncbi:hypothetical protein U1Q18_011951 [Sarracenia purpurea var. burkii]
MKELPWIRIRCGGGFSESRKIKSRAEIGFETWYSQLQFRGELPSNLGNSPASVMNFANNEFSGNIPFSFGYVGPRLKEITFLNNRLNGCIPEGVWFWQDLKVLDMSFNSLVGQLPDSVSCLSEIEVLNLAHNELSGVLSDLVCSLESLENLSVAYNADAIADCLGGLILRQSRSFGCCDCDIVKFH